MQNFGYIFLEIFILIHLNDHDYNDFQNQMFKWHDEETSKNFNPFQAKVRKNKKNKSFSLVTFIFMSL